MSVTITKKTEGKNTYIVLTAPATNVTWFSGSGFAVEEMVPNQAERLAREILKAVDEVKKADNARRMYTAPWNRP